MDAIDLMAIKPWQIKKALGTDCIKVVRGSRKVYNVRQARSRRGQDLDEPDLEGQMAKPQPIWRCTDVVCGGMARHRPPNKKATSIGVTQTNPIDLTHYGHTAQQLRRDNITILTASARDIQDGVVRPRSNSNKVLNIDHRGSSAEIGSQVAQEPGENQPKSGNVFKQKLQGLGNFFRSFGTTGQEDTESSWSSSDVDSLEDDFEERDHEWLEHTSTELSRDDVQEAFELDQKEHPPTQTRIELQCFALMSSIKPFLWFLKCGGRWPLQTYVEDHLVKFRLNRWAPNFILFVITTLFLLFCASHGVINIIHLLRGDEAGGYQTQVMKVLFNKYWPYTFVTIFYSIYVSIWSLGALYDDGLFLAQFMSRWNFGVALINYDPCEFVRWDMWWSLGWLIFYFSSLTIFYIWDMIPAVRGTSELLGMIFLHGFVSDENLGKYRYLIRLFGFLFHLYVVFSARLITMWALLYCKFLENIARRWNLRFCYVFEMLGRYEGPNTYVTYHTVIPLTKLFTEHKLITAVSRYTGKIFRISLTSYFLLKGLEMVVLAYSTCSLIIFPPPVLKQKALPCSDLHPDCEPVPFLDADVFTVMTILYFTGQSILGWYFTTDSIAECGQAIMSGFVFVRRYGFPRCKNCKERRFIQSLNFTFSSVTDYYINAGFKVNRKFIYEMFSWVFVLTSLVVLFSPFQLHTEVATYCHNPVNGTKICYRTTIPRATLYKLVQGELKKEDSVTTPRSSSLPPNKNQDLKRPDFAFQDSSTVEPPPEGPSPPPSPPSPPTPVPILPNPPTTPLPTLPPSPPPPPPSTPVPVPTLPTPPTTPPPSPTPPLSPPSTPVPVPTLPSPPTTPPPSPTPPLSPPSTPVPVPTLPSPPTTPPPSPTPPLSPPPTPVPVPMLPSPPTTPPPSPSPPPPPPSTPVPVPMLPNPPPTPVSVTSQGCTVFPPDPTTITHWDCDFYECDHVDGGGRKVYVPVICDSNNKILPPYERTGKAGGKPLDGICYRDGFTATNTDPYKDLPKPPVKLHACSNNQEYEYKILTRRSPGRDGCGNLQFYPDGIGNPPKKVQVYAPGEFLTVPPVCVVCYKHSFLTKYHPTIPFGSNDCYRPDPGKQKSCSKFSFFCVII